MVKVRYVEPADYFPKEIREQHKLGEYDESGKEGKADNAPDAESENVV